MYVINTANGDLDQPNTLKTGSPNSHAKKIEYAGSLKALKSTIGPDFLGGRRDLITDSEISRVASMMKAITRTAHPKPIFAMSLRNTKG